LLLFLACLTFSAAADTLLGRVIRIADGDTITIQDHDGRQHKIRLNGIDAPEIGQEFGLASKRHLTKLILDREVAVSWRKVDRYGRLVAKITIGDRDVNLEQLRAGMAWYFRKYAGDIAIDDRPVYEKAEADAKGDRRGLWEQTNPIAPWDYRAGQEPDESGATTGDLPIIGNRNSGIYHRPDCPDYRKVSPRNRVEFKTEDDAVRAGFRKAGNCR
jgi:endonuclease YncB( thermonuclease family)